MKALISDPSSNMTCQWPKMEMISERFNVKIFEIYFFLKFVSFFFCFFETIEVCWPVNVTYPSFEKKISF